MFHSFFLPQNKNLCSYCLKPLVKPHNTLSWIWHLPLKKQDQTKRLKNWGFLFFYFAALTWALNLSLLQGAGLSITLQYVADNKKHILNLKKSSNRFQAQHAFFISFLVASKDHSWLKLMGHVLWSTWLCDTITSDSRCFKKSVQYNKGM